MGKIIRWCMMLSVVMIGLSMLSNASPQSGEVYKEFHSRCADNDNGWRVTDPTTANATAKTFLPNDAQTISLVSGDLQNVIRAEIIIDRWGGHAGTINKVININGNSWISVPNNTVSIANLGACGGDVNSYMLQDNVEINITSQLSQLTAGTNNFNFACGDNSGCDGFHGWGQWGQYGVILRLYYTPSAVSAPSGTITGPTAGTIGESVAISLNATPPAGSSISKVDYVAYYDGFDENGNNYYLDWHEFWNRLGTVQSSTDLTIRDNVGSATSAPWGVTWNTKYIPDQGSVKLKARIKAANGYWYVTPEITNLTISHAGYTTVIYKPNSLPADWAQRTGVDISCTITIPAAQSSGLHDLTKAIESIMYWRTWASDNAPFTINAVNAGNTQDSNTLYTYALGTRPVDKSLLSNTAMTVKVVNQTVEHGTEVLLPGPVLLVRYNTGGMQLVADPVINPNGGTYTSAQTVYINCATGGAVVKYTTDGSNPSSTNGNVYSGPITLSGNATIKAMAYKSGMLDSNIVTAAFTITLPTQGDPLYYVPVTVAVGSYARSDKPVEVAVNFTQYLTALSVNGSLNENSLRVRETDSTGNTIINDSVVFQFDKDSAYNAASNAIGTVTFMMSGTTNANATRYFRIYFDVDSSITKVNFTNQVTLTDNVTDEGQSSYKFDTANATYYYHKIGAGFSSMVDSQNNDWLSYSVGNQASGEYRGIPNMVHDTTLNCYFHPGFDGSSASKGASTSNIVSQGPLKVRINSISSDNNWKCYWDIFPKYARMTLYQRDPSRNYWFLYEGTPGGTLNTASDYIVQSNNTQMNITATTASNIDLPDPEWVYFADGTINRSLYVINHNQPDNLYDTYYTMAGPTTPMTVFGFGRGADYLVKNMNFTPAYFTIGFADSRDYATTKDTIESAWRSLTATIGTPGTKVITTEPIKLHPDNPHYFLYKGKPTVLVGSNEHYGSVMNLAFDYVPYLNELQSKGLNYVQICSGMYAEGAGNNWWNHPGYHNWWNYRDNPLGPDDNKFVCPWRRTVDLNTYKFDLSKWDDQGTSANSYFPRLKDFVQKASDRGIVVDFVFFIPFWNRNDLPGDEFWKRNPMNSINNINGVGNTASWTTSGLNSVWDLNSNGGLTPYINAMITKVVTELNGFDNVMYLLTMEPNYNGTETNRVMSGSFDSNTMNKIIAAEASLPKKHLIVQNAVGDNNGDPVPFTNANVIAWDHYDEEPDAQSDLTANYLSYNKPLACTEVTYQGDNYLKIRRMLWKWILAGGALWNLCDDSFTYLVPDGSVKCTMCADGTQCGLTTGDPSLRGIIKIAKDFIHSVNFVKMTPDSSRAPAVRALVGNSSNKQYAYYLGSGGQASLTVNLVAGNYKAEWVNTKTGNIDKTETFTQNSTGSKVLTPPAYTEDIALRILDTTAVIPPNVSITSINVSNGGKEPATLTIDVDASSSLGIKQVDFYNGSTWLGTDTGSPYEFVWNNVPAGSYSITAKATDNNNTTATTSAQVVTITGGTPATQQAYPAGVAWLIGAGTTTIQAEDYDMMTSGTGEGEAYHDTASLNEGNSMGNDYRTTEGVDVRQVVSDAGAGYQVGWTAPGEWLEYSVNVNQAGNYKIILRGANGDTINGGPIHIEFVQNNATYVQTTPSAGTPPTGSYDTFTDVTLSPGVTLNAGNQTMKLVMDNSSASGNGDINYIQLIKANADLPVVSIPTISPNAGTYTSSVTVTLSCTTSGAAIRYTTDGTDPTSLSTLYSAPFTLTASATIKARAFKVAMTDSSVNSAAYTVTAVTPQQQAYPAGVAWLIGTGTTTIQAEDYDMMTSGTGEGNSYHDLTTSNEGGAYRTTEAVDVEACTDTGNGYDVGWTQPGEWLEYSVNVNQSGEYKIILRTANGLATTGNPIHLEFGTIV
ncbi:MAG: chitobiase/beta-hexosaminidase C-terminal domain-containing protein [Elusimicrobia bacterium]|nr:chitobiase/beta-hexosaminidase C-terminal domain-containing protein [Elusimicrobiota bacterium]